MTNKFWMEAFHLYKNIPNVLPETRRNLKRGYKTMFNGIGDQITFTSEIVDAFEELITIITYLPKDKIDEMKNIPGISETILLFNQALNEVERKSSPCFYIKLNCLNKYTDCTVCFTKNH